MSLYLDAVVAPAQRPLRVTVDPGDWAIATHPDADALVAAVAGVAGPAVGLLLGDDGIGSADPARRHDAGLAVVLSRLGPLPGLRVVDLLTLSLRGPRPSFPGALAGTRGARARLADDIAGVRAMAGRLGAARWLDAAADGLPPDVEALVDALRGLAGAPTALVWRCPQWLDDDAVGDIADLLADEQRRLGFALLELRDE